MKVLIAHDPEANDRVPLADLSRAGFPPDCEVLVVCIADALAPPAADGGSTPAVLPPKVQAALDHARVSADAAKAALLTAFPSWSITPVAALDSPAWGIVRKAEEWGADLIVVGDRQHSALARLALGSVSQKILHEAHRTVRIVKRGTEDNIRPPRLLIGIDGSDGASVAVSGIVERHWPKQSLVRIVSVDEVSANSQPDSGRVRERAQAEAQRLIDHGLATSVDFLQGDVKDTLLAEAESWHADCIFVGARGLNAVERLLLGSVSSAIAVRAPCSVEVVWPPARA